jgi:NDP-sugar pyrophosphorylase family protein
MPAGAPALVLTAGLGTRLRPLSFVRAKAALPVAGEPLVRRILRWLERHGVREVVLNLHHRPETIARVLGDGSDLGVRVRYSWEQPLLGSAGGPRKALPLLDADRFLIVNGDTLTDVDPGPLEDLHASSGALVTMALIPNPDPMRYGGVVVRDGWVRDFTPKGGPGPSFHFIGVQMAESAAFADLPDNTPAETVNGFYRRLVAEEAGRIRAFVCDAAFHDIGTARDYLTTTLRIAADEGLAEPPPGEQTMVHPTARLVRTVLWDRVSVAAGAELIDCVVADNVAIPAGARMREQVIVPAAAAAAPGELFVAPLGG